MKRRVYDSILDRVKKNDPVGVAKLIAFDKSAMLQLTSIREALTTHSVIIHNIWADPNMSTGDKRQAIDTLYFRMTELAENGNKQFREIEQRLTDVDRAVPVR